MSGFIFKLQNVLTSQSHANSSDAQIAKLMLQNLHYANKNVTITQLAKACYTSVSSISRFATNLGYDSFNEMKQDFIGIPAEYDDLQVDNSFFNTKSLRQYKEEIINSFEGFNEIDIKDHALWLAEFIFNQENVYIFSTHIPSNIISILHRAILATGKYVEFVQDKHEQIKIAENATSADSFIFVSLDGTFVMAKEITIPVIMSGAKKVLITQNTDMKFASNFDYLIPLGSKSPIYTGKYKLLLFVDYFINVFFTYANEHSELLNKK